MFITQRADCLRRILVACFMALTCMQASYANTDLPNPTQVSAAVAAQGGIVFTCPGADLPALANALAAYFESEGVESGLYAQVLDEGSATLQFLLQDRLAGTDTLNLIHRLEFNVKEELVQLPTGGKWPRTVVTVSRKEILLALLQRGRTTRFGGNACAVEALADQVGIRQNTVAWAESLALRWPNGNSARWNAKYWVRGDLKAHQPLHQAIADVFLNPQEYAVGCYAATKLVVIQGILDYYRRVKKDVVAADAIARRLMQGGEPLAHIEPGAAWYFEKDFNPQDMARAGKLTFLVSGIPADNFVPGDWTYFLNTDSVTYEKTGYEGSNVIYLGRGKFDDYYNDNNHSYTYREKLLEVYQWRHKVFSRTRDVANIHPLTAAEIQQLTQTPEQGGLQLDYRIVPYTFGFTELPAVAAMLARP